MAAPDATRSPPARSSWASGASADFALCLLAALLWSWPFAARLTTHLRDAYDAQACVWLLSWVPHALLHAPAELFQANAYAPARDVLAFSEPLVGYGVLGIPFSVVFGPVGVHNALCLLGLAFTPWAIARLAGGLGAPRGAALLGALAASYGALATAGLGYVFFGVCGGIALAVSCWLRLRDGGSLRALGGLTLALAALGWFYLQLMVFGTVALAVLIVLDLARRRVARPAAMLARLALAGAAAGLLLLPLALVLLRVRRAEGFRRDEAETRLYSASARDALATTHQNPGQAFLPFRDDSEKCLYPGSVALGLAMAGLVLRGTRRGAGASSDPSLRLTGSVLVAVSVLGALGYNAPFYPLLVRLVPPLFGGIRAVCRFFHVVHIGLGLLAADGAARLFARLPGRRSRVLAGAVLLLALAADVRQTVRFGFRPEVPPPPVEAFLAQAETAGPILHLPLHHGPGDARTLFASIGHFKPVVNGTLSYVPARHRRLSDRFRENPVPQETLSTLETWPVGTLVAHDHALPFAQRKPVLLFLAEGVRSGRLEGPLCFPHRGGIDLVFGLARVRGGRPWGAPGGGDPGRNAGLLVEMARDAPDPAGAVEDPALPASIDAPPEESDVSGDLVVKGWAETKEGAAEVLEVWIDRDRRPAASFRRIARPDVARALPALGPCAEAGYEQRLPFLPGDDGRHELSVLVRSSGGRIRTLRRAFTWAAER